MMFKFQIPKHLLSVSLLCRENRNRDAIRQGRRQGFALVAGVIAVVASFGCGTVETGAETDASVTRDASNQVDSGANADASVPDASVGPEADAAVVSMPSLPDYLGCERDSDCPIGLGDCITAIPFNLADSDGVSMVAMQDVFPSLTTAGVCTLLCTDNALICDGLQLQLGDGPVANFSCQLITTGRAPYPAAPTGFPLTVDEAALAAGQAFAALCRPPFQLASDHSANLCDSCTEDSQCGSGDLCWASGIDAIGTELIPGECLETCLSDTDCVVGFGCDELLDDAAAVLGNFCVPVEKTCGPCRDVDGDGRGVGLCSSDAASPTAYDCDDSNADAYFDPLDPTHPFPTFCDEQDFNCNGLSDQVEQLVSEDHCGACNTSCLGAVGTGAASAQRECQAGGICGFVCDDPLGQIDCDGDASNGCEIETVDVTKFVYWDNDTDGDGTFETLTMPQSPLFLCEIGDRPAGYSLTNTDCDDIRMDVSGQFGVDNQCDAVDQDCDGPVDEGFAAISCTSSGVGICTPGTTSCSAGNESCVSNLSPAIESCSDIGVDNDCDGITNDIRYGATDVNNGDACIVSSAVGECRNGTLTCFSGSSVFCFGGFPTPDAFGNGLDENCDGIDGDASDTIYVSTSGNNGADGSPTAPKRTILGGIAAAVSEGRSTVRVASGTYTRTAALRLSPGVTVIGGHNPAAGWEQSGGATIVDISSNAGSGLEGTTSFNGSVGLHCVAGTSGAGGGMQDMTVNVHRRTTGSNGEAVVGAWFTQCPYLSFQGVSLTVDSGAPGVDGQSGVVGANGGTGVNGEFGTRGDDNAGGAWTSGGVSTCQRQGGSGGRGGNATDGGQDDYTGVSGGNVIGASGGPGGGEPVPLGSPGGTSGEAGTIADSVGSGGARGVFSAPNLTTILFTGGTRRGATAGNGSRGGGGGGGGGGSAGRREFVDEFLTSGSSGGSGGAAGCIGGGGEGGRGGGATIGAIVSVNNVSLSGMTIVVNNGGAGGAGGNGGAGGSGGTGGTGAPGIDDAGAGGNGGSGGGASGGGGGGGAAGGHCIGVIRVGGVSTGSPSVTLGSNGAGGAAGAGGGIGALQGDSGTAGPNSSSGIQVIAL